MISKKNIHIIAEIGVNHNGDIKLAKRLMLTSKKLGADSVKFQTYDANEIVIKGAQKADYQIINTKNSESQYDMLKRYEFSHKDYLSLVNYSNKINIPLFSTACDIKSLNYLTKKLKLKTIKISSSDLTNIPLLLRAGASKKNIIISSGMSDLEEIDIALSALSYGYDNKNKDKLSNFNITKHNKIYKKYHSYLDNKITLLHCTTEYPAPINELNINIIDTLKKRYKTSIGYSDHSNNPLTPIIASSKNISVIEVHVTLDKSLPGPDHLCSLNPQEFQDYIKNIRNTELILGSEIKKSTKSEIKNKKNVRKSLIAKKDIIKGEAISEDNMTVKRPGKGIPSLFYNTYIGKVVNKNIKANKFIRKNDIKS